MSDQLEQIKELHDKANSLYPTNKIDDKEKATKLVMNLFEYRHTDWLIEQAEKLEKVEKAYFDDNYNHSGFMEAVRRVLED
jgi:hypothetical protein